MAGNKSVVLVAALAVAMTGGVAVGSTIDLSLSVDAGAGTWDLFATIGTDDGDTAGIAGMSVDVSGSNGLSVDSSSNELPKVTETADFSNFFTKGFKLFTNDGACAGGSCDGMGGAQDNVSNSDGGSGNDAIIRGIGLGEVTVTNGLLPDKVITNPVLVATGTFSGLGDITASGDPSSALLLPANTPQGATFATLSPSAVNAASVNVIPEPATAALVALSGIALIIRRRVA